MESIAAIGAGKYNDHRRDCFVDEVVRRQAWDVSYRQW